MKALVLDENIGGSKAVASVLSQAGFDAVCLDSFDAALDEVLNSSVHMIFSPVFLGSEDIGVFMSKLRSFGDGKKAGVPVVAVSPVPMDAFFEQFYELELFGYIEKPFSPVELVTVARKAAYHAGLYNRIKADGKK